MCYLFLICTSVPATSVLQLLKKTASKTQPFMVVREGMWDSEFLQGCSLPCPCPSNMQCWDFPSHILHPLSGTFCITVPQVLHSRHQKGGWWESLFHFQTCCLSLIENLSWSGGQRVPRDLWARAQKPAARPQPVLGLATSAFHVLLCKMQSSPFPSAQRE